MLAPRHAIHLAHAAIALAACAPSAGRPALAPSADERTATAAFIAAFADATRALIAERFADAVVPLARAEQLDPGNDVVVYLAAVAANGAHDAADARRWLERLDALASDVIPNRGEFAAIADDPVLARVTAAATTRAAAESRGVTEAFRIAEPGLGPEGIAYDPVTRAFLIGSTDARKIIRVRDGRADEFVPTSIAAAPVLGLRVDAARRRLWAACEAYDRAHGAPLGDELPASVSVYDADTGVLIARYLAPLAGKHLLNDVTIAPDGTAYVTDSEAGQVWRVAPGAAALAPVVPPDRFVYPNGIAWDAIGGALLIADAITVWRLELAGPAGASLRPLIASPGVSLAGLDGMYLAGDQLIGVQNLVGQGRVVAFALAAGHARVTGRRVLASSHPALDTPTTGALAPGGLYLLANARVRGPTPSIVLRVPLAP